MFDEEKRTNSPVGRAATRESAPVAGGAPELSQHFGLGSSEIFLRLLEIQPIWEQME